MVDQSPIPYTVETPYLEPLGGSETAFTLLARGLHTEGHAVILLNNTYTPWSSPDNRLMVNNLAFFDQLAEKADVIIANRTLFGSDRGKPFYYWSHDAYDQAHIVGWMADRRYFERVTQVWCVSEWQRRTFIKYLNAPADKLKVLGDPIDLTLYVNPVRKDPKKFVFASIPYKGIEFLPRLWQDIRLEAKDDKLTLEVFSSMKLYHRPEEDEQYKEWLTQLASLPGVRVHEPVSMLELAKTLAVASYYLHPSTYHETFGLVVAQHMATGGLPIAPSHGALPEVVQDAGFLVDEPNIWSPSCYAKVVETAVKAVKGELNLYQKQNRARRLAQAYDYHRVARRALKLVQGG